MIYVLRIFGHPVVTFGPEYTEDELELQTRISNTGGQFELAQEASEVEYEEEESDFGFRPSGGPK